MVGAMFWTIDAPAVARPITSRTESARSSTATPSDRSRGLNLIGVDPRSSAAEYSSSAACDARQKPSWSPSRNVRPSFSVFVICPKFGDDSSTPGSTNCGVLKKLIDSARNVSRISDRSDPRAR